MRFDDKFFQRFLSGNSTDEEFQQVESYLNSQPGVSLADYENADDTLVTLLQQNPAPLEFSDAGDANFNDPSWEIIAQNLNRQFSLATRQLDISQYVDPPQDEDELGRVGEYRLLKQIGSGGMGIVFEAELARTNQRVAVKLMNPMLAANPEAAYRFRRESLAAAELKHENIVRISEVDQTSSIPYLVMELLQGESLAHRLRTQTRLPAVKIIEYSIQIAEALQFAHQRGLLHRDIKPDNIWIDEDDTIKLLDFGLARTIDDQTGLTQTGAILGTPKYMSPEQAKGHSVDQRSDLFSLGSVMYEMLFGRPAFDRENFYSTIIAVANEDITSVDSETFSEHNQLHQIVAQLLKKDPKQRIESAAALKKKLQAIDPDQIPVTASASNGKGNVWKSVLLGFAAASILFVLSLIIYVQTDRGTLVIDASDDVEVSIVNQTIKIRELGSEKEYQLSVGNNRLPSGAYEIIVADPATGLELSTTHFSLKRGDRQLVSVGLKKNELDSPPKRMSDESSTPEGQSITEVFSELNVGRSLAITPNNSFNRFGIIPNPKTIDGIENWSIETEQHRLGIQELAFNFDGTLLATTGSDSIVRIWDCRNGNRKLRNLIPINGQPYLLRWSPVKNQLAVCLKSLDTDEKRLTLWQIDETASLLDTLSLSCGALAWSPNGEYLAIKSGTSDFGEIHFFQLSQGRFKGLPNRGISGRITERPWSYDERFFAVSHFESQSNGKTNSTVEVWEIGKQSLFHKFSDAIEPIWAKHELVIGLSKKVVGPRDSYEFELFDFQKMKSLGQQKIKSPFYVFCSGTSNFVALPLSDEQYQQTKYNTVDTLCLIELGQAFGEANTFEIKKRIRTEEQGRDLRSIAISPTGEFAFVSKGSIVDSETRASVNNLQMRPEFSLLEICKSTGQIAAVRASLANEKGNTFEVDFYENNTGKRYFSVSFDGQSHTSYVSEVSFSPSGRFAAVYLNENLQDIEDKKNRFVCKIVDLKSKKTIGELEGRYWGVAQFAWAPSEKYVVLDSYRQIDIYQLPTRQIVESIVREAKQTARPHTQPYESVEETQVAGVTEKEVIWYVNPNIIYSTPNSGGATKELINFPKLLSQHNKDLSISSTSLACWNPAKNLIAIAADITDRTSYPRSERKSVFVIETNGETPKIVREFNVDNDGHFGKLAFTDNGRFVVCLTQPIDQIRDHNTRTVSGASHLFYYDLESESNQQDPFLTFDKSIAPEIYVGTDSVAFNQFGISYVHGFEKKSVSVFHNQSASELTEVRGHWLACDSSLIRGIGTRPFEQYAYLINHFDPDHDYSGIVFGEDSIRKIPPNKDLSGLYFVEISGNNNQHFRTIPLSEAIKQHPELVQGAARSEEVAKNAPANERSDSANNADSNGIDKTLQPRMVTEVLSPARVGNELAIEASKPPSEYSFVTKPIKLPNIETWTIESEESQIGVQDLAFSFDGKRLATASNDGNVRIYRYSNGTRQLEHIVPQGGSVKTLAWSPVENVLMTSCKSNDEGNVILWRIGEKVSIIDQISLNATEIGWSPTGTKVAIQSDQIYVFDVHQGRFRGIPNQGITGLITQRPWSFDERFFAYTETEVSQESDQRTGSSRATTSYKTVVHDLQTSKLHHQFNECRDAAWCDQSLILAFQKTKRDIRKTEFWDMETLTRIAIYEREQYEDVIKWRSTANKFAVMKYYYPQNMPGEKRNEIKSVDFQNVRKNKNAFNFDQIFNTKSLYQGVSAVGPNKEWANHFYLSLNDHADSKDLLAWIQVPHSRSDERKLIHAVSGRVAALQYQYRPDGMVAFRAQVNDVNTGKLLFSEVFAEIVERTRQGFPNVLFSPNGNVIAISFRQYMPEGAVPRQKQSLFIFDIEQKKKLLELDDTSYPSPVHITPDEKRLIQTEVNSITERNIESNNVASTISVDVPDRAQSTRSARPIILHLENDKLIWVKDGFASRKIMQTDFKTGESNTLYEFKNLTDVIPLASLSSISNINWNESLKRAAFVVYGSFDDPKRPRSRPSDSNSSGVVVLSFENDEPKVIFSFVPDAQTKVTGELKLSKSGRHILYVTSKETPSASRKQINSIHVVSLDDQQKRIELSQDRVGSVFDFPVQSGFWLEDRQHGEAIYLSPDLSSPVFVKLYSLVAAESNADGFLMQTQDAIVQLDHQCNRLHTVLFQSDKETTPLSVHGKVGSERFGPWVKEAPGMFLVTVSDDPEVGIVTRPLDSVRSVYPELFQE